MAIFHNVSNDEYFNTNNMSNKAKIRLKNYFLAFTRKQIHYYPDVKGPTQTGEWYLTASRKS